MKTKFKLLFIILLIPALTKSQTLEPVKIMGTDFISGTGKFFPVVMNYSVDAVYRIDQNGNNEYFIAPNHDYGPSWLYDCADPTDCYNTILTDFQYLKSIGFNMIRLVGSFEFGPCCKKYGADIYCPDNSAGPAPEVRVRKFDPLSQLHPSDYEIFIPNTYPYTFTTDMLSQVFQAAETAGLRVLYLSGGKRIYETQYKNAYRDYVDYISFYYSNEDILFGYDLFNEPLYNRNINPVGFSTKNDICETTAMFYDGIHDNAPDKFVTMGLVNSGELNHFDPGILKLDFLSYHIYPYNCNAVLDMSNIFECVKSEIKWMAETSTKPWMLGEIGFRAADYTPFAWGGSNSFTYLDGDITEQYNFAKQTIEFVRDCGGDGYSWWDFIDGCVPWGSPFAILRQDRSEKPVVDVFRSFKADEFGNTCYKPFNYYDHYGLTPFEVHGYIYDQTTNAKIENAVIQGWDASWDNSCSTYSDQDGYYSLKSSHPINIMTAVAIKSHTLEISGNFTNQDFYLQRFQPADLYLTGSLSNTDYAATGSIYSLNVYTSANNTLNLKAGQRIVLMTGFHSEENSYGRYHIEDFFTDCGWVQTNYRMHSGDEHPSKESSRYNHVSELVHPKLESAVIVHAYPNPTSDQLIVEFDTPVTVTILLLNASNNCLVEEKISNKKSLTIDTKNLTSGIYSLHVVGEKINTVIRIGKVK